MNPAWSYGNVRDLFDCKSFVPEGILPGADDKGAHCVWWDYATKHNIPVDTAVTMTYGREYDKALREAFFNILRSSPATFPQLHTLCVVDILQTTPRGFSRSYTKGNVSIETVVEQDPSQNEVCPKEAR